MIARTTAPGAGVWSPRRARSRSANRCPCRWSAARTRPCLTRKWCWVVLVVTPPRAATTRNVMDTDRSVARNSVAASMIRAGTSRLLVIVTVVSHEEVCDQAGGGLRGVGRHRVTGAGQHVELGCWRSATKDTGCTGRDEQTVLAEDHHQWDSDLTPLGGCDPSGAGRASAHEVQLRREQQVEHRSCGKSSAPHPRQIGTAPVRVSAEHAQHLPPRCQRHPGETDHRLECSDATQPAGTLDGLVEGGPATVGEAQEVDAVEAQARQRLLEPCGGVRPVGYGSLLHAPVCVLDRVYGVTRAYTS